jgi:hypothetical protein
MSFLQLQRCRRRRSAHEAKSSLRSAGAFLICYRSIFTKQLYSRHFCAIKTKLLLAFTRCGYFIKTDNPGTTISDFFPHSSGIIVTEEFFRDTMREKLGQKGSSGISRPVSYRLALGTELEMIIPE